PPARTGKLGSGALSQSDSVLSDRAVPGDPVGSARRDRRHWIGQRAIGRTDLRGGRPILQPSGGTRVDTAVRERQLGADLFTEDLVDRLAGPVRGDRAVG